MSRGRGGRFLPPTVLALATVSFFTDVASEMIYPLLPLFLTGTLGASVVVLGLVEGAAESVAALLKLASGWWSDKIARRKPLVVAGYLLASVARPLVAFAVSAPQVLAIRLADRTGKGIRTSPRDALISDAVAPEVRGRAFGFHRAADHAGALVGPAIAFLLLGWGGLELRTVFLWAALPGAVAVAVLVLGVREARRGEPEVAAPAPGLAGEPAADPEPGPGAVGADAAVGTVGAPRPAGRLGGRFWGFLVVVLVFTLGNSTDAFLLVRAVDLGVAPAVVPLLWAFLHLIKMAASTPGGMLSDRIGRRLPIAAGWLLYAAVYLGFGLASAAWHMWALFAAYGVYYGLTEGVEKALVADLAPARAKGAAFGWYHLALGVGALPASVLFGAVWSRAGTFAAFALGSGLALAAVVGLLVVVPRKNPSATVAGS